VNSPVYRRFGGNTWPGVLPIIGSPDHPVNPEMSNITKVVNRFWRFSGNGYHIEKKDSITTGLAEKEGPQK
jgi:hypothetical protein